MRLPELRRPRHVPGTIRSVRFRAVLALGVLVAPLGVNTMASWSSRAVITPGPVVAGSFDLKVNGGNALAEAGLRVDAMVPGTSTAAVFTVSNASVADHATLLYTIAAIAADGSPAGTAAALTAKVTTDGATTTTGGGLTCAGTGIQTGTSFNGTLVGTPRTLVPGASQKICIQATLAPTAPASGSSTITVTFRAVQKDPQTP